MSLPLSHLPHETSQDSARNGNRLLKQPLCARQNGFFVKEHKLSPGTKRDTPGFLQLIYFSAPLPSDRVLSTFDHFSE